MRGRAHEAWGLPTGVLTSIPFLPHDPSLAAAYLGGYTASFLFFSPDLDLEGSRSTRRWGILSLLWAPYRLLHPHRGSSHTYLYGPVSRLAYTALLVLVLARLAGGEEVVLSLVQRGLAFPMHTGVFFLGYFAAQWVHLIQDGILPFGLSRRRSCRCSKRQTRRKHSWKG